MPPIRGASRWKKPFPPPYGTGEMIEPGQPKHIKLDSSMLKKYADLRRQPPTLTKPYVVSEAPSRKENSFICNETHWRALNAVKLSADHADSRLKAAYFIHIPYADPKRGEDGYEELAAAVAALIARVVALEAS